MRRSQAISHRIRLKALRRKEIIDTKGTFDERPFSMRKASRSSTFVTSGKEWDEERKEREGRVRETHRPSRHARAAA